MSGVTRPPFTAGQFSFPRRLDYAGFPYAGFSYAGFSYAGFSYAGFVTPVSGQSHTLVFCCITLVLFLIHYAGFLMHYAVFFSDPTNDVTLVFLKDFNQKTSVTSLVGSPKKLVGFGEKLVGN